jgi:hypothetical protein
MCRVGAGSDKAEQGFVQHGRVADAPETRHLFRFKALGEVRRQAEGIGESGDRIQESDDSGVMGAGSCFVVHAAHAVFDVIVNNEVGFFVGEAK